MKNEAIAEMEALRQIEGDTFGVDPASMSDFRDGFHSGWIAALRYIDSFNKEEKQC